MTLRAALARSDRGKGKDMLIRFAAATLALAAIFSLIIASVLVDARMAEREGRAGPHAVTAKQ